MVMVGCGVHDVIEVVGNTLGRDDPLHGHDEPAYHPGNVATQVLHKKQEINTRMECTRIISLNHEIFFYSTVRSFD